jgi:hypothetical protein
VAEVDAFGRDRQVRILNCGPNAAHFVFQMRLDSPPGLDSSLSLAAAFSAAQHRQTTCSNRRPLSVAAPLPRSPMMTLTGSRTQRPS